MSLDRTLLQAMNDVFPIDTADSAISQAAWPPDLFAITSSVLSSTGLYRNMLHLLDEGIVRDERIKTLLSNHHVVLPHTEEPAADDHERSQSKWAEDIASVGKAWGKSVRKLMDAQTVDSYRSLANAISPDIRSKLKREMKQPVAHCVELLVSSYSSQTMSEHFDIDEFDNHAARLLEAIDAQRTSNEPEHAKSTADLIAELSALAHKRNEGLLGIFLLLTLHGYADEACGQIIAPSHAQSSFDALVWRALYVDATLATAQISRGRVLPKRRTPEVGLTLRTLSAYVGYHRSSVDIRWRYARTLHHHNEPQEDYSSLSVLILPWPLRVHASDFRVRHSPNEKRHGFFFYDVGSTNSRIPQSGLGARGFIQWLDHALTTATKWETGGIDLVILPECAVTNDYMPAMKCILASHGVGGYIVGVGGERKRVQYTAAQTLNTPSPRIVAGDSLSGINEVHCGFLTYGNKRCITKSEFDSVDPSKETIQFIDDQFYAVLYSYNEFSQSKHHRWRLSEAQMAQYQLGWHLPARAYWWEGIRVPQRSMTFVDLAIHRGEAATLSQDDRERSREVVTICPLICEDLARQDPMADLVRTVGPSLVVAILLDGPQLPHRWPGRYAGVLADDPGSSVLTVTSYGMVERTHARQGLTSSSVALWRDSTGRTSEIELGRDQIAILLGIGVRWESEHTMAGRNEQCKSAKLTLNGHLPFGSTTSAKKHRFQEAQRHCVDLLTKYGKLPHEDFHNDSARNDVDTEAADDDCV